MPDQIHMLPIYGKTERTAILSRYRARIRSPLQLFYAGLEKIIMEVRVMSDIMLHGVLNMPPELWTYSPMCQIQRHSRYVEASVRIENQEAELLTLRQFKADIEEQHRLIMSEKCAPDEHHCTCVPVLRDKLNRSNAKLLKVIELYIVPDDHDQVDREKWLDKYLSANGLGYLKIKINKSIDS